MAPASSTAPSVVNRKSLLKDPSSKLPPTVVKNLTKPEQQPAVQLVIRPLIQDATVQLDRDLGNAKTNAEVPKLAAANDLALAKALNQTSIMETKTYAFTKRPDPVSALFGSLMRYPGQAAPVGTVEDSIAAPSSLRFRGGASDLETVNAIADYANTLAEPVSMIVFSRNAQEVMERKNN